jgi:hypothetical protein
VTYLGVAWLLGAPTMRELLAAARRRRRGRATRG